MNRFVTNLAIAVCAAAASGLAQPVRFEVATVKFSPSAAGRSAPVFDPQRLTWRGATLKRMICEAYHVEYAQVRGAPPWSDTERYDVEAKAERPSTRDQMRQMLQSLLAERFHLAIQKQRRPLPAYVLSIAKGGPRLAEVAGDSGQPQSAPAANYFQRRVSMEQLAALLSQMMNGPVYNGYTGMLEPRDDVPSIVVDGTGLRGVYDVQLDLSSAVGGDFASAIQGGLSRLGLQLESRRVELDVLSVSRVERTPTAN